MKYLNRASWLFMAILACQAFSAPSMAQETAKASGPKAKLLLEYGLITSEQKSAYFDIFFSELKSDPTAVGYVYLYCGRVCRYGEIEAHMRGIEAKTSSRRSPRDRFVVINAGFKESQTTELWVVPAGACLPPPSASLNIKQITFKNPPLRGAVPYDCCD